MTKQPTTETDAADNGDETETDSKPGTTDESTESETDTGTDEEVSQVTPREKELRRLLRANEKELVRLTKADEDRRRAELSETEKLREELAERDERLGSLLRKNIVAELGLDVELAGRLQGVTEEELREDAERLAKLVKPKPPKSTDVGIGVAGTDEAPVDPVEAHRRAMASRNF